MSGVSPLLVLREAYDSSGTTQGHWVLVVPARWVPEKV